MTWKAEFVSTPETLTGYDFNSTHSVTGIYSDCYNSSDDDSDDDGDDSKNEDEVLFCAPTKIAVNRYQKG